MSHVVIFGNGYSASVAHYYLTHDSQWRVVGFTADEQYLDGDTFEGLPAVPFGEVTRHFPPADHSMTVQVSYTAVNRVRADLYQRVETAGYRFISYVSSRAAVWPDLRIGANTFILDRAVINPFAQIGNNVTVCSSAIVGHHVKVGDHSFLASNCAVLGFAKVGAYCVLGANSTVRDGVRVGANSFVGANVFVSRDTESGTLLVAPEAKRLSRSSEALSAWLVRPQKVTSMEGLSVPENVETEKS